MIKSFKIRLYPNKNQSIALWNHVHASRYIYNYMLSKQLETFNNTGKYISCGKMCHMLIDLKNNVMWLRDIASSTLQIECKYLDNAYTRFFKNGSGLPKFKSKKRSKDIFPVNSQKMWFDCNKRVHILKVGKIKFKTDLLLPIGTAAKFSNAHIKNVNGKWMLLFSMECDNQAHNLNSFSMGIDLGIKSLATVAYEDKKIVFTNINKGRVVRGIERDISHIQKAISRKYFKNKTGCFFHKTNNIVKMENKIRKLYARLSNIRINYIHQVTSKLIKILPRSIIIEDLNISGMLKNRHLSKAVQDQCLYEFIRQLQYKCMWNGIELIRADRFYPSSKTCHNCGCVKRNLTLRDRVYICDVCGYVQDRDFNAALNLMNYRNL